MAIQARRHAGGAPAPAPPPGVVGADGGAGSGAVAGCAGEPLERPVGCGAPGTVRPGRDGSGELVTGSTAGCPAFSGVGCLAGSVAGCLAGSVAGCLAGSAVGGSLCRPRCSAAPAAT